MYAPLDARRERTDVALDGASGGLAEVEERAHEPCLVFRGGELGFERDDRGERETLCVRRR